MGVALVKKDWQSTSKSHSRTQSPNANHNLQMLATDTSIYLFIFESMSAPIWAACEIWNKEGKSFLFEGCWTSRCMDICTILTLVVWNQSMHTHMGAHNARAPRGINTDELTCTPSLFYFLLSCSVWVVLENLRCVIRHWFPSEQEEKKEKKYLTERYIKRGHSEFLTFFAQLLQNE